MTELVVNNGYLTLDPESQTITFIEGTVVNVTDESVIITDTHPIVNTVLVETNTDYTVVEQEIFIDFNEGGNSGGAGGISDVPRDGQMYVRKDKKWLILDRTSFPTEVDTYLHEHVDILD